MMLKLAQKSIILYDMTKLTNPRSSRRVDLTNDRIDAVVNWLVLTSDLLNHRTETGYVVQNVRPCEHMHLRRFLKKSFMIDESL